MPDDLLGQSIFQSIVLITAAFLVSSVALLYFRRVRLERPAVGTFNFRDVAFLMVFILALPALYLFLPYNVLTGFLAVTFVAAMWIGLRPLVSAKALLPFMAVMIAGNIFVTYNLLGTRQGWQAYWLLDSAVVLLAAVGVANLYVQGGMRLRHIAWFTLALAVFDLLFTTIWPVTLQLADVFEGRPLNPAMGWAYGPWNVDIGLGDLLVYGLFTIAAYKGFGRRGAATAMVVIGLFGALAPSFAPLALANFIRDGVGVVVPAQTFFGPFAFLTYKWLSRSAPERSMAEYRAAQDAAGIPPPRARRRAQPAVT